MVKKHIRKKKSKNKTPNALISNRGKGNKRRTNKNDGTIRHKTKQQTNRRQIVGSVKRTELEPNSQTPSTG